MGKLLIKILVMASLLFATQAFAQAGAGLSLVGAGCHDSGAITKGKFITGLCYPCIFPIRIAGTGAKGRRFPGDMASAKCLCPSKLLYGAMTPGATYGMWKPTHFVEAVRQPGCFAALGQNIRVGKLLGLQQGGSGRDKQDSGFMSAHMYLFPTGAVLDAFTGMTCSEDSFDLDLVMITEIDPTYSNPLLSMIINPESFLFANPIANAACMVDAAAASVYRPIKELFWCLGSWGQVYPLSGHQNSRSAVQDASLAGARLVAMQHKRFLMNRTYGNSAVCMAHPMPLYQKQQYRWQIMNPLPQRVKNDWTGAATIISREFRHLPVIGEDWVQVLWRYEECCVNVP